MAVDRVTGYDDGVKPSERIDEIALGDVHLEMLDEDYAMLIIGEHRFKIGILGEGQLIVRAETREFDPA